MSDKSSTGHVNIDVKARADAKDLVGFGKSLADLQRQLTQAKRDFNNATPGTEGYTAAIKAIGQLSAQITAALNPVREYQVLQVAMAENTHRVNAMLTAGINPWTTATAKYREAQAALQAEAQAARQAAEEHEKLARAKAMQAREMRNDAVLNAQRQMAADLRAAEEATRRLAKPPQEEEEEEDEEDPAPKAERDSRNVGMSILMFSQALEDAQYGIKGVINNSPALC